MTTVFANGAGLRLRSTRQFPGDAFEDGPPAIFPFTQFMIVPLRTMEMPLQGLKSEFQRNRFEAHSICTWKKDAKDKSGKEEQLNGSKLRERDS
jgi:hypothetical protein